jgi:hypothetical protein
VKVVFPDTIQPEIEQYIREQEYIAVIYVDSSKCTPCSLHHLTLWKTHIKELNDNNTGILLIICNSDEQAVIEVLKAKNVVFPFIIDKGGKFKTNNEIFKLVRENTFVMDKNQNVIFTESPIKDDKTWKMFVKKLNN